MTEASIIQTLYRSIDERKYPFQLPNCFIYSWECDYWAMDTKGVTKEFEIKISRSDYFNDAKKDKHKACNGANYFYYVCPEGLIKPEEVDNKYGLIYINKYDCAVIVKKPKRLNNNEFKDWKMLAYKMYWKFWSLWRQKLINKEITHDEYMQGFNFDLNQEVENCNTSDGL